MLPIIWNPMQQIVFPLLDLLFDFLRRVPLGREEGAVILDIEAVELRSVIGLLFFFVGRRFQLWL